MAQVANYSVFHFIRRFVDTVGIPPRRYVMAVRIDLAKAELVKTDRSVRDICLDLGYTSVGTFTSQFTRLVGVSPNQVRRLRRAPALPAAVAGALDRTAHPPDRVGGTVRGRISGPTTNAVLVGLFADVFPAGQPSGCAALDGPGPYVIRSVPPGRYFVHAAAFRTGPQASGSTESSEPPEPCRAAPFTWSHVGSAAAPVVVTESGGCSTADVSLRPTRPTDPPILGVVPT